MYNLKNLAESVAKERNLSESFTEQLVASLSVEGLRPLIEENILKATDLLITENGPHPMMWSVSVLSEGFTEQLVASLSVSATSIKSY